MSGNIVERADQLARDGNVGEAVKLLESGADEGDPSAQFEVAQWRLFGIFGPRDPDRTMQLLARARELDFTPAAKLEATLLANGGGGRRDIDAAMQLLRAISQHDEEVARQLDLVAQMAPLEAAAQLPRETLSEDPPIHCVRGVFTPAETGYLIEKATPKLSPSYVVDPQTGQRIPHPIRTSSGMNFGPTDEDFVIHQLNMRIAAVTGTTVECGEMLHILRYVPGEQYRPHLDALDRLQNQRVWTVLVYLNEEYAGGETEFPLLDIQFKGSAGDALIFRNTREQEVDVRTRHAGLPVTDGTKWMATRWIRQLPFSPWDEMPSEQQY